ncbi:MAG TPA: TetR/AcrR family transcriptional regulator [Ramlibacter sp.]|nr:TetR/AcrR family transcriptional regulator [Ramlibacter sp.]
MSATSDTTRTKRLPRDERISRILAVTRELLEEKGYDGVLTAEIAVRCGLSEAAIYKYFESKRELLVQVAERWYEEMLAEDHRSFEGMTAFEALRHVIWRHFSIVKRYRELTRFMLLDLRPDPKYRSMRIYQLNRQLLAQVPEVLHSYMASGHLRNDIPMAVIRDMIFGAIEHQTWAFLRHEGDFSIEESTNGIARLLYEGLSTPQRSEPSPTGLDAAVARLERVAQQLERQAPEPAPARKTRAPKDD